jgi:hypothetical protein
MRSSERPGKTRRERREKPQRPDFASVLAARDERRVQRALVAAVAAVALTAGCGQSAEEQVSDAIAAYLKAVAARDGAKACAALTPAGQRQLVGTVPGARRCEDAAKRYARGLSRRERKVISEPIIEAVRVDGSRATARVKGVRTGRLVKVGDDWKLDAQPESAGAKRLRELLERLRERRREKYPGR